MAKGRLTNEAISKKFKSQFELVNHAIKRAEVMIGRGEETGSNQILHILEEITADTNQIDLR